MTCHNYEDGSDVLITQSAGIEERQQRQDVVERNDSDSPPDGGWGWVVCLGVSVVNFLTVGQQNSAGVIYDALMEEYSTSRGETAWVASLASSMMYLFAAVGTSLAERFGSRLVVIIGSFVSASGLLASSFATTLAPLYATYGVVWGLGASLGLFPSLVILTKYFKRRLALVSGISLAGAASGALVYGPIIQMLSTKFGISTTFRILAGLQSLMLLSALTFTPVTMVTLTNQQQSNREFDLSIFKNKAYVIWVVAQCIFMVVFLVPFVHLVRFAEDKGVAKTDASFLTGYMAIGGVLGSLVLGALCDYPRFNRLKVCPAALLCIGISTSAVTIATRYAWIGVYAFTFGVCDGCYEMLLPVITRDIVGVQKVGHAIGALYCLMAFPKTLGPPMVGWIFDASKNYSVSFYVTGGVALMAAVIMYTVNWVRFNGADEVGVRERLLPSVENSASRQRQLYT